MSKIKQAFKKKAFIPFITCGCPSLEISEQLVYAMEKAGADIIELGIPFSDPTAEGSVIQKASMQALQNNVTTNMIFEMVQRIRKQSNIPLVFMTYANVVFSYGIEKFISRMKEYDMDGLILPDVPFEEKEEFDLICKKYDIDFISLIAPTSKTRIEMISSEANGFVYCVSSMGTTGQRNEFTCDLEGMIKLVKKSKDIPCAIGFGISNPKQAKQMSSISDGVIVGSAIVQLCLDYQEKCIEPIYQYVKEMKEAIE